MLSRVPPPISFLCACTFAVCGWAQQPQEKPSATAVQQPTAGPAAEATAPPPASDQPNFKPEEIEQLVAPIALYPDSLLAQVLMASTYPVEVVEAERWMKANANLKGDALAKELEKKTWDASVRSLVNFPDVLAMMSEHLDTTVKIGDAFIGQREEVMQAVQKLRAKAQAEGNLKSNEQQNIKATSEAGTQVIVIESSNPDVVYVPTYDSTVVYGGWPYPAYTPYPYYPPGYVASNVLSFGVGVACGVAWGYAWGGCNWGGNDIDIDIDRNTNRNTNIDRSKFKNSQRGNFKHDPSHRRGAAYRNEGSARRAGATGSTARTNQARSEFRGKAEAGRADIARGGADSARTGAANRSAGTGNRAGSTNRAGTSANRGAMSDVNRGGSSARQSSSRGSASRASSPSRSSGMSRGGSRGGGGRGGGRR